MVMADRQTNSIWSHLDGAAIEGPLTGTEMDFIPLIHTTWEEWQTLHPETTVISYATEYQAQNRSVTPGMPNGRFARDLQPADDRPQSGGPVRGGVWRAVARPLAAGAPSLAPRPRGHYTWRHRTVARCSPHACPVREPFIRRSSWPPRPMGSSGRSRRPRT